MDAPSALSALRWIHIPAGLLGLAVFWLPLVLKKGGLAHRRVGWVFVVSMAIASVTAAALAVVRLLIAKDRAGGELSLDLATGPLFLFNVSLLTATAVHHGISVLRQKRRQTPGAGLLDLGLPGALVLLSIFSLGVGVITRNPLLFTLPTVGLLVGAQHLLAMRLVPRHAMWWWFQHMAGMLGGCIAALTAALITNARHIRPYVPAPEWAYWIAPAAIGIPLLLAWQAFYWRKFNAAGAAITPASTTK